MTVIVFSAGFIAADMRQQVGATIGPPCQKLVQGNFKRNKRNVWYVAANFGTGIDATLVRATAQSFLSNPIRIAREGGALPDDCGVCGVAYTQGDDNYRVFCITDESSYFYDPVPDYVAWGAGEEAALAAIHMGASAPKAAQIACFTNSDCGGPIQWVDLTKDADQWVIQGGDEASFNRLKRKAK